MSATEFVCFTVTGEFITNQARSFWAEEDEPEKALNLLKCMDGITDEQCIDILEGRAKLVGDSNNGVYLEKDSKKLPTLAQTFARLKRERDEAREDVQDLIQIKIGDTVGVASPEGLRMVPWRRTKRSKDGRRVLNDGLGWKGCVGDDETVEPRFYEQSELRTMARGIFSVEEDYDEPQEKEEPPPHDDKITHHTGWLTPDGKFYKCNYGQHNETAARAGFGSSDEAYVKCAWHCDAQWFFCDNALMTEKQKELVKLYCSEHGTPLPWYLEDEGK